MTKCLEQQVTPLGVPVFGKSSWVVPAGNYQVRGSATMLQWPTNRTWTLRNPSPEVDVWGHLKLRLTMCYLIVALLAFGMYLFC